MHDIPDTEDTDSAAERFWPEGYKKLIRAELKETLSHKLLEGKPFKGVYEQRFVRKYADHGQFLVRLAEMMAIGAENGADDAFDEAIRACYRHLPLPEGRPLARYYWQDGLPVEFRQSLHRAVVEEYSREHSLEHLYEDYYQDRYRDFKSFVASLADLMVIGGVNGADEILGRLLRSFIIERPLPPARRHPRRLKT